MAARKRKSKKKANKEQQQRAEVDDLLDEVLGEEPEEIEEQPPNEEEVKVEDSTDEQEPPVEVKPPDGDREETEREEDEDGLSVVQSDSDSTLSVDSEEKEEKEEEKEEEKAVEITAQQKRDQGLLGEIDKLRKELAKRPVAEPAQLQLPNVPLPQETTAPPPSQPTPGQLPVIVSEDGQDVYTDPVATNSQMETIARRMIEEANTPSPAQVKLFENRKVTEDFIAQDPTVNQSIAVRMREADDFITLHIQKLMNEGHRFASPAQAARTMSTLGVDKEVFEYFPEVEHFFEEFVEGSASGNAVWRGSLLQRLRGANGSPPKTQDPLKPNIAEKETNTDISRYPSSMAKKGGARSTSPSSDESEFEALSSEFNAEVVFMPEARFQRMKTLGRLLEKPGFD